MCVYLNATRLLFFHLGGLLPAMLLQLALLGLLSGSLVVQAQPVVSQSATPTPTPPTPSSSNTGTPAPLPSPTPLCPPSICPIYTFVAAEGWQYWDVPDAAAYRYLYVNLGKRRAE